MPALPFLFFFFFNDTATTEIYTLSLHDALPISLLQFLSAPIAVTVVPETVTMDKWFRRSEEHTSELQSPCNLVCRLLLEKKKRNAHTTNTPARCPSVHLTTFAHSRAW